MSESESYVPLCHTLPGFCQMSNGMRSIIKYRMELLIIKIFIFKLAKDTKKKKLCFLSASIYLTVDDKETYKQFYRFLSIVEEMHVGLLV